MKRLILVIITMCIMVLIPMQAFAFQGTLAVGSSGSDVAVVQQRLTELGYFNFRATAKFSDMTADAVRRFQQANGLPDDGQVGADTYDKLFSLDAKRAPRNTEIKSVIGQAYNGKVTDKGALSSWDTINRLMPVNSVVDVTDYNTGISYQLKRIGGENCAQVITPTEEDYEAYRESFGNGVSWEHRAVLVTLSGVKYAASLFGMPGGATVGNSGMKGSTTLYFNNSKTDVNALPDEEHLTALGRAAGS